MGAIDKDDFEKEWAKGGYNKEQTLTHLLNTIKKLP